MADLYNHTLFDQAKKYYVGQCVYIYDGATASNSSLPSFAVYKKYIKGKGAASEWELFTPGRFWRPFMPEDTRFLPLPDNLPAAIALIELQRKTLFFKAERNATANIPGELIPINTPGARTHWPVGYSGGHLYVATDATVEFGALKTTLTNPYNTTSIRVWIRSGGDYANTLETGTTFWYYPPGKSFLPIPMLFSNNRANSIQDAYQDSIRGGKILAAMATGLSREAATNKVDNGTSSITGPGSGAGSQNKNQNQNATTEPTTRVKVRGNFGYLGVGQREGLSSQMVQMYSLPEDVMPRVARHKFDISPGQISYSNLGSDWQEIERVGQVALIDWKNYKLLKISFQFIIIPDKSETYNRIGGFSDDATNTSITVGVDKKIRNLRAMATRPYPIALYGFDDMMTNQLRFPSDRGRGVEFVIADLSISSIYRTESGEINRATCDITLQEVPLEAIRIIEMPKLVPEKIPKNPPPPPPPVEGETRLFTDDSNSPHVTKNIETETE